MSTPDATNLANLQLATLGALEWTYTGAKVAAGNAAGIPPKHNSAAGDKLAKQTADDIIVRVQRDPNTTLPTRAIRDAGPIWLASAFAIPKPLTTARTGLPTGTPADSTVPPYTRVFGRDDDGNSVNNNDATFADWLLTDGKPSTRAKTARCWTFEEAVEAGARLASDLTDPA